MLYIQNQDLSATAPEEIAKMYDDAYHRICAFFKNLLKEKKEQRESQTSYF